MVIVLPATGVALDPDDPFPDHGDDRVVQYLTAARAPGLDGVSCRYFPGDHKFSPLHSAVYPAFRPWKPAKKKPLHRHNDPSGCNFSVFYWSG
jgi:hypothetical protein